MTENYSKLLYFYILLYIKKVDLSGIGLSNFVNQIEDNGRIITLKICVFTFERLLCLPLLTWSTHVVKQKKQILFNIYNHTIVDERNR